MGVFWATNCAAATFAWFSGIGSFLYLVVVIIFMIATAPAYDRRVRRAFTDRTRRTVQWTLWAAPGVLFFYWAVTVAWFGWPEVACYVRNFSLGMGLSLGPILLAIVFVTARLVGEKSAR